MPDTTVQLTKEGNVLPDEIMERFCISRHSLYALIKAGRLHPVKLNSRVFRFLRTEVDALAPHLEW